MWLLKHFFEEVINEVIKEAGKQVLDQAGPIGQGLCFLLVGLSLMIGGPIYMRRDNRCRIVAERKPRYGFLETAIVVIGGGVFSMVGILMLAGVF
jgi:hypothetical protein